MLSSFCIHQAQTRNISLNSMQVDSTRRLDGVSEECCIVALLTLKVLLLVRVLTGWLVLAVSSSILPAQVDGHDDAENGRHGFGSDQGAMAGVEHWRILRTVQEPSNGTTKIAESNMHGCGWGKKKSSQHVSCETSNYLQHGMIDLKGFNSPMPTPRLVDPPMLLPFHATP